MTIDEQLDEWVKGNPIHNADRDECCPDFSCCQPQLLAPKDVRENFAAADEETRFGMLIHFLGAGVAAATDEPEKIYVAGQGAEQ